MSKAADRETKLTFLLVTCVALLTLFVGDASAQGRRPAPCRDGQLSASKLGEDAAMGGARMNEYALTNTSSEPCTLEGHPRFEVLSRSGRVFRRGRAAEGQSARVMIEPGRAATFSVRYNAGGAGRVGRPCTTYPRVRVTAPGHKRGLVLREPMQLCGEVEVSPVGPPAGEGR